MDFDFTDEQEQLRDAVRKWVDKGYDFERRRSIEKAGGFSREAYTQLAELGLAGLYIPEAHDGLGMGPVEGIGILEPIFWGGDSIVVDDVLADARYVGVPRGPGPPTTSSKRVSSSCAQISAPVSES